MFTVVQDGGTSSMMLASEVPYTVVAWFRDYASGQGYVAQGTAWQRVGTTLVVNPTILANGQIRVRLVPQVSYFTAEGGGSVEFNEAATEVIVPSGRAMRIGGGTRGVNQVTRQILGYREQQSSRGVSMSYRCLLRYRSRIPPLSRSSTKSCARVSVTD